MSPIGEAPPAVVLPLRPTYATRVLPPAEWDRLQVLPFAANGLPDPDSTIIFVDETPGGEIVGIWGIFLQPMLDGLWVHPDHRSTIVAGQLLKAVKTFMLETGVRAAFTQISEPGVMTLAHKAGFTRAPGDLWWLQVQPDPPTEEP
jgi:GNAT superfamily N-acetyltransferase